MSVYRTIGPLVVLFRSSDLYTHQNPSLLLFHSAGHRHACIIIETLFVTFVSIITWKMCPNFFQRQECSDEFLVQSSLNFCYICYFVTGVTKCVCWKICVLFVKYLAWPIKAKLYVEHS